MHTITRLAFLTVLVLLLTPGAVSAHAELVRAVPEGGAVLTIAPTTVAATFSEQLGPDGSVVTVVDSHGNSVTSGTSALDANDPDHKTMTVPLKAALGSGTYTVRWTSLAADDGHEESGTFTFTVRRLITPSSSATRSTASRPSPRRSADASAYGSIPTVSVTGAASQPSVAKPVILMPATGGTDWLMLVLALSALGLCLAGGVLRRPRHGV